MKMWLCASLVAAALAGSSAFWINRAKDEFPVALKAIYYIEDADGTVTEEVQVHYPKRRAEDETTDALIKDPDRRPDMIEACRFVAILDQEDLYYIEDEGPHDSDTFRDCKINYQTERWFEMLQRLRIQQQRAAEKTNAP